MLRVPFSSAKLIRFAMLIGHQENTSLQGTNFPWDIDEFFKGRLEKEFEEEEADVEIKFVCNSEGPLTGSCDMGDLE